MKGTHLYIIPKCSEKIDIKNVRIITNSFFIEQTINNPMKKIIFLYSLILFLVITYPLWISTGYVFSLDNSPLQSSYYCRMQFDGLSPGVNLVWCFFGKIFPDFMFIRCIFVLTF